MGTQKNRLDEMVLFEHPKQMFKLMDKKIYIILRSNFAIILTYVISANIISCAGSNINFGDSANRGL